MISVRDFPELRLRTNGKVTGYPLAVDQNLPNNTSDRRIALFLTKDFPKLDYLPRVCSMIFELHIKLDDLVQLL
jgi:hypothetical protein